MRDIKRFDRCRKNLCSGNEKAAVANNPIAGCLTPNILV